MTDIERLQSQLVNHSVRIDHLEQAVTSLLKQVDDARKRQLDAQQYSHYRASEQFMNQGEK